MASFIPTEIENRLNSEKFSFKEISIVQPICGRIDAKVFWPVNLLTGGKLPKIAGGSAKITKTDFALYIIHLEQIINTTYLNLAHFLSKRVDCPIDPNVDLPEININLFYLDYPKVFKIGEDFPAINGGFAQFGGSDKIKIVVFRKEEMGRVLVHELIHAFEYDVMHSKEKISAPYKSCDGSKININEAITDFAANIMISKISGFLNYTHERIWSYVQAARVTKLLGFNSVMDIFSTSKCIAEKTSLIAYYILKSALLHTYRTKTYRKFLKNKTTGGRKSCKRVFGGNDSTSPNSTSLLGKIRSDDNTTANLLVFVRKFRKEPGDKNKLRELSNLVGKKFSERERTPKDYSFERLISAAIRDPEWQMEVDRRISHPKLFKDGIATARMSISEYLSEKGHKQIITDEKFYEDGIYDIL